MAEIVVLEREADIYAARLREQFPSHVVHAAQVEDEALAVCKDAEILIALAHEVSQSLVSSMPRLQWIAALTTGTDHLHTLKDLPAGLIVTSGRGIHGPQMAELTFYYMIALSRDGPRHDGKPEAPQMGTMAATLTSRQDGGSGRRGCHQRRDRHSVPGVRNEHDRRKRVACKRPRV
jgi:phosphoglycerate dehydrogenase-like enzyme